MEKANYIDRFGSVLNLRWASLFSGAQNQLMLNHEATQKRLQKLPLEEDVSTFREYSSDNGGDAVRFLSSLGKLRVQQVAVPCVAITIFFFMGDAIL